MQMLAPQFEGYLRQIRKDEDALLAFLAVNPGVNHGDVVAEYGDWPRALKRFRVKTADEKWCEWQSDNHGWGE